LVPHFFGSLIDFFPLPPYSVFFLPNLISLTWGGSPVPPFWFPRLTSLSRVLYTASSSPIFLSKRAFHFNDFDPTATDLAFCHRVPMTCCALPNLSNSVPPMARRGVSIPVFSDPSSDLSLGPLGPPRFSFSLLCLTIPIREAPSVRVPPGLNFPLCACSAAAATPPVPSFFSFLASLSPSFFSAGVSHALFRRLNLSFSGRPFGFGRWPRLPCYFFWGVFLVSVDSFEFTSFSWPLEASLCPPHLFATPPGFGLFSPPAEFFHPPSPLRPMAGTIGRFFIVLSWPDLFAPQVRPRIFFPFLRRFGRDFAFQLFLRPRILFPCWEHVVFPGLCLRKG